MTQTWKIEGMECEHCQRRVFNALAALDAVSAVDVSLENNTATLTTDKAFTTEEAAAIMDEIGYDFAGMA